MRITAISHLKAKLSEHIAWVKRGEEVLITERGKPVARIVPVAPGTADDARLRALVARGVVRSGKKLARKGLPNLPVCRVRAGAVLRALDDERRDRA
jgi:prevent-host-death family protein